MDITRVANTLWAGGEPGHVLTRHAARLLMQAEQGPLGPYSMHVDALGQQLKWLKPSDWNKVPELEGEACLKLWIELCHASLNPLSRLRPCHRCTSLSTSTTVPTTP
jgi:hypothetical protein